MQVRKKKQEENNNGKADTSAFSAPLATHLISPFKVN